MKTILLAATFIFTVLATNALTAQSLLGVDFDGTLYDINITTGAATNPRITQIENVIGISFAPNGTLYGVTSAGSNFPNALFSFNSANNASQLIGFTGLHAIFEGDIAFDPTTGVLYGIEDAPAGGIRDLFTIDTSTGAATIVGSVDTVGDFSAMAFDAAGSLFVLDTRFSSNRLLRVDKYTATITSSVNVNFAHGLAGMDFNPVNGILYLAYGIPNNDVGGPGTLNTLNIATGVVTPIGSTHLSRGLSGLAFFSIPEPSSFLLAAFASLCAFHARSRRR